jgi:hypothetical protein
LRPVHRPGRGSGAGDKRLPHGAASQLRGPDRDPGRDARNRRLPSNAAAARAAQASSFGSSDGLDAFKVPGTAASGFGNAQRQLFGATYPDHEPYIFLTTAGFADGRVRTSGAADPALEDLTTAAPGALVTTLTKTGDTCQEQDVRC